MLAWQLIQSGSKGTSRLLHALTTIADGSKSPRATKGFVVGGKVITVVVIKSLPFDGHLLRMRNRDPLVLHRATNPDPDPKADPTPGLDDGAKKKKKPKAKKSKGAFERGVDPILSRAAGGPAEGCRRARGGTVGRRRSAAQKRGFGQDGGFHVGLVASRATRLGSGSHPHPLRASRRAMASSKGHPVLRRAQTRFTFASSKKICSTSAISRAAVAHRPPACSCRISLVRCSRSSTT